MLWNNVGYFTNINKMQKKKENNNNSNENTGCHIHGFHISIILIEKLSINTPRFIFKVCSVYLMFE